MCVCVFLLVGSSTLKKQKQSVTFQSSSSHTDKNADATEPQSCPLPSPTSWCHSTASSSHKRFIVTDKATSPLLQCFDSSEPYLTPAQWWVRECSTRVRLRRGDAG